MNFAALLDLEKTPGALPYDARGYDLDGFREWLVELGNPERGQRFIHIAGTKGKGSTAALCEAMLLALGFDTATFTSPHLAHFGERYRYNAAAWTPEEFEAAMERLNLASQPPRRDALKTPHRFRTAFEFMTMAALVEFGRRGRLLQSQNPPRRQIVCWETGLGGRLDCTNVVDPAVSVITTLGLDHTAILGETIEEIASEKAGIIKPQRPVVVARQSPDFADRVLPIVRQRAKEVGSPLHLAWEMCPVERARETAAGQEIEFSLPDGSRHEAHLALHGDFQRSNVEASLAATWLLLHSELTVGRANDFALGERIAEGIAACRWPGRMEIVVSPTGQSLVLDGAHCSLSAAAAARTLASWRGGWVLPQETSFDILWGMQRDKKHREFLDALLQNAPSGLFHSVHTYPVTGVRGADAELLAQVARESGLPASTHASPEAALDAARMSGRNVFAVGTLYTVAALRDHWKGAE